MLTIQPLSPRIIRCWPWEFNRNRPTTFAVILLTHVVTHRERLDRWHHPLCCLRLTMLLTFREKRRPAWASDSDSQHTVSGRDSAAVQTDKDCLRTWRSPTAVCPTTTYRSHRQNSLVNLSTQTIDRVKRKRDIYNEPLLTPLNRVNNN